MATPQHVRDRNLVIAAAFLRALGTSMLAVRLGTYFSVLFSKDSPAPGWINAAGLAGCAVAALAVTFAADRCGRRASLVLLALLTAAGAFIAARLDDPWLLGLAAFVGMINAVGKDRGAALVLEQAILPSTTDDRGRTGVFAAYSLAQDIGHAMGAFMVALPGLAAWMVTGTKTTHVLEAVDLPVIRFGMYSYVALCVMAAGCYLALSRNVESPMARAAPLSPRGRRVVSRISALFSIDAIGGGFLTTTVITMLFIRNFGVSEMTLGLLFTGARLLNAVSHLGAAWLSKRIGLLNTMVFTHIPSSLLLMTTTIVPNFWVAGILFLLREGLVEMDVPTRQSYLMAVVEPGDRMRASGITALVRMAGWAIGAAAVSCVSLEWAIGVGAGLKIIYDVALYAAFRRVKPPEEQ